MVFQVCTGIRPFRFELTAVLTIKAGNVLYRLNPHNIQQLSSIFCDMVGIGSQNAGVSKLDGQDDRNPIHLHDSVVDINAFFKWLTRIG